MSGLHMHHEGWELLMHMAVWFSWWSWLHHCDHPRCRMKIFLWTSRLPWALPMLNHMVILVASVSEELG